MDSMRVRYFDTAKSLGILLMIFAHTLYLVPNSIGKINAVIYTFHMPLFLFVSGYFYKSTHSKEAIKKYVKTCIRPCVFTLLLSGGGIMGISLYISDFSPLEDFMGRCIAASGFDSTLIFPAYHNVGPLWYLISLTCGGSVLSIILTIEGRWFRLATILGCFLVSTITTNSALLLPWCLQQGLAMIPFLYFGYQSKQMKWLDPTVRMPRWLHLLAVLLILATVKQGGVHISSCHFPIGIVSLLGSCVATFYIMQLLRGGIFDNRFFDWLGQSTIHVLCMHSMLVLTIL